MWNHPLHLTSYIKKSPDCCCSNSSANSFLMKKHPVDTAIVELTILGRNEFGLYQSGECSYHLVTPTKVLISLTVASKKLDNSTKFLFANSY